DDLSHDGRGVARHEGKTVFVSGALPGEKVEIAHYRRQKRFSECETRQIQESSEDRVSPECPHYEACGGCQLQHLSPARQLFFKQQSLLSLLKRQQGLEPEKLLQPVVSSPYGYRSRVRLGVDSQQRLAFREQGNDKLVAIDQCSVLHSSLTPLITAIQAWLDTLPPKAGVSHIELVAGFEANGAPMAGVVIRHVKPLPQTFMQGVSEINLEQTVLAVWFQAEKNGPLRDSSGNTVDPRMYFELIGEASQSGSISLGFHPQDFTQVNAQVNPLMVSQAIDWLDLTGNDRVVDLFCGIGNFTLPIAQRAATVIGVEAIESMVVRGQENSARNALENCTFKALNLESQALGALLRQERINKLMLDPPRSGAKFVCEQMAESEVERLVYVSCNPASFARDAAILASGGYKLMELRALDMFPQTAHMETMALFVRV
uniref:23S rRNA (uracil(1939)-C(5))-methyltransferase RlmD n=1 Tax=Pseudomaricurvus sp. TaxID=2004510 RepID=UPI003F6ABA1D